MANNIRLLRKSVNRVVLHCAMPEAYPLVVIVILSDSIPLYDIRTHASNNVSTCKLPIVKFVTYYGVFYGRMMSCIGGNLFTCSECFNIL